jgi:hypothetical protein
MDPSVENFSLNPQETSRASSLAERVALTQKEVGYVQQTTQYVAEFLLRRLNSTWGDDRGGAIAAPIVSLGIFDQISVSDLHKGLFLHALIGQLYAFSGGKIAHHGALTPLWLDLMLAGSGLRRMTTETALYAERIMRAVDGPTPQTLGRRFVSDPWKAYRLGLFSLVETLLSGDQTKNDELRLRVRLAATQLDSAAIEEIDRIAPVDSKIRASLISSAVAYAIKQKQEVPATLLAELDTWVDDAKGQIPLTENAPLIAQVFNANNLYLLSAGRVEEVEANMRFLLSSVTPLIANQERRAHIEGNAHFQSSVLARRRNDRVGEMNALINAMNLDRHFATLYYRMAQIFHDQGDTRAGEFYELALALSPFDFPTANDYGCFLSESGQNEKFNSWVALCQILYPEHFSGNPEERSI